LDDLGKTDVVVDEQNANGFGSLGESGGAHFTVKVREV
jgi:hypothetical protein